MKYTKYAQHRKHCVWEIRGETLNCFCITARYWLLMWIRSLLSALHWFGNRLIHHGIIRLSTPRRCKSVIEALTGVCWVLDVNRWKSLFHWRRCHGFLSEVDTATCVTTCSAMCVCVYYLLAAPSWSDSGFVPFVLSRSVLWFDSSTLCLPELVDLCRCFFFFSFFSFFPFVWRRWRHLV